MKVCFKRTGFIAVVQFLLLFTACGSDEGGTGGNVSISITPAAANTVVGVPKVFTVSTQNTGFDLSTTPTNGAECVKGSDSVTCTPSAATTYTITVTATANRTKTMTATLIVTDPVPKPEPAIEITGNATQIIYADQPESKQVTFHVAGEWTAFIADESDDWLRFYPTSGYAGENSISI